MNEHTDDEGGEAPCYAHLLEAPETVTDGVLAQLARHLGDALVIADPKGTIIFWNDAATALFGWPATEAVGRSLDLIIPERLRTRHWNGYERAMRTGHTTYGDRLLEVPALHQAGHTISIAFTITLLAHGPDTPPFAIAAVIRDETARWRERQDLQQRVAILESQTTDENPS
jgi:PAS domain S-box-containing protein